MKEHHAGVSRRTALRTVGIGSLGLALAPQAASVSAQDASAEMASHPIVGTWLVTLTMAPDMPPVTNASVYGPDGSLVNMAPVARQGPQGVTIASAAAGRWESAGGNAAHFTMVQVLSTLDGMFVGTVTIDGHPTVSDDGLTFMDNSPDSSTTIRDPMGKVLNVIPRSPDAPPVTAVRIEAGAPGFPEGTPEATPAS
jgi:hypothetical protein